MGTRLRPRLRYIPSLSPPHPTKILTPQGPRGPDNWAGPGWAPGYGPRGPPDWTYDYYAPGYGIDFAPGWAPGWIPIPDFVGVPIPIPLADNDPYYYYDYDFEDGGEYDDGFEDGFEEGEGEGVEDGYTVVRGKDVNGEKTEAVSKAPEVAAPSMPAVSAAVPVPAIPAAEVAA